MYSVNTGLHTKNDSCNNDLKLQGAQKTSGFEDDLETYKRPSRKDVQLNQIYEKLV